MATETVCVSGPLTISGENLEELGETWRMGIVDSHMT